MTPTQNTTADDVPLAVSAEFCACTHVALPVVTTLLDQRAGPGMALAVHHTSSRANRNSPGTIIASAVELHTAAKQLSQELDDFGARGALGCWKALFKAAVTNPASSGTSLRALDVKPVPLGSLGDQSTGVGATVTVANGGRTVYGSGIDRRLSPRGDIGPGHRAHAIHGVLHARIVRRSLMANDKQLVLHLVVVGDADGAGSTVRVP